MDILIQGLKNVITIYVNRMALCREQSVAGINALMTVMGSQARSCHSSATCIRSNTVLNVQKTFLHR